MYIGKEDKRQGITRNPEVSVIQRLRTAENYSNSRPDGLTQTETTLLEQAENKLSEAIKKTNSFFETEWVSYRNNIEKITLSPFKEVKSFSLD